MPLDRLILILAIVIAAAGATVWGAALLSRTLDLPGSVGLIAVPVLLGIALIWRVTAARMTKRK